MSKLNFGKRHYVKGLDAVADAFDTTQYSDVINVKDWQEIEFLIHKGVGTTGTSTITVEACDDVVPTNVSAIAFRYQAMTGADDVPGAITAATSAGFATTAGSSQLYRVAPDLADLAASGYHYVRVKAVEVVNSPVLGGIIAVLSGPRYGASIPVSAIV